MKLFSKNIIFIVRDNQLGSYYLDLGYLKVSANDGMTLQSSDNFVSVKTFTKIKDMLLFLETFKDKEFNFSMALDPKASDLVIEKYFQDQED